MRASEEQAVSTLTRRLSDYFEIYRDSDGDLRVRTNQYFPDGDGYIVLLDPHGEGWKLSDGGNTFMQLGYYVDTTNVRSPEIAPLLKHVLESTGACEDEEVLSLCATTDELPEQIFTFCTVIKTVRNLENTIIQTFGERRTPFDDVPAE